ncbi:MAG: hypothetical protein K0S67_21 [Nitrososphaeraceae archaeon]|jgi:hypothetical protein|nr:hypothetical protein [Nitrososphaeraceae archaeon]
MPKPAIYTKEQKKELVKKRNKQYYENKKKEKLNKLLNSEESEEFNKDKKIKSYVQLIELTKKQLIQYLEKNNLQEEKKEIIKTYNIIL